LTTFFTIARAMAHWVRIARVDECPPGQAREYVAEDRIVALFNVDGQIHALDGVCSHQGGPLGKGRLQGCIVTCPWHGWQFDVGSGQNQLSPGITQPRFAARVEDGWILVDLG
jgi:nitrite reductase/ring-hydroxylating ferredoxin subunit